MSNVIDFNTRKAEKREEEKMNLERELSEFNSIMNRAKMKADNGKTITDDEAYAILEAMSGLALSQSPAWEGLTEEDFGECVVYGAPKGTEF